MPYMIVESLEMSDDPFLAGLQHLQHFATLYNIIDPRKKNKSTIRGINLFFSSSYIYRVLQSVASVAALLPQIPCLPLANTLFPASKCLVYSW